MLSSARHPLFQALSPFRVPLLCVIVASTRRLGRGDLLPHLQLPCPDGSVWDYGATTWQRNNLLLLSLPSQTDVADVMYVDQLLKHAAVWMRSETTCVLTREPIDGMPTPGLLIADRWGEIYVVADAPQVCELPGAAEVAEWLRFLEHQCPECQGEVH